MAKRTNFEKVREFNTTSGVACVSETTPELFTKHPDIIKSALSLIDEEVQELKDAINAGDLVETRDALADILYVVYGMAFRLGIDADHDFNLVHESNMTKFCETEDEARATVELYAQEFAVGKQRKYATPAYRFEPATGKWVIYDVLTTKVLKNMNYKPVNLTGPLTDN